MLLDLLARLATPHLEKVLPYCVKTAMGMLIGIAGPVPGLQWALVIRNGAKTVLDKCDTPQKFTDGLKTALGYYDQIANYTNGETAEPWVVGARNFLCPFAQYAYKFHRAFTPLVVDGTMTQERWDNIRKLIIEHTDAYLKQFNVYATNPQEKPQPEKAKASSNTKQEEYVSGAVEYYQQET